MNCPSIRLVYIASNVASHAEYAIKCLNAGKSVHIEKPHVVNYSQLSVDGCHEKESICQCFSWFNRPKSSLFLKLRSLLSQQQGPFMINWFIAGHEIPDNHWYFDESKVAVFLAISAIGLI